MVTYFVSIADDKDRGWAAPSDDSGKIFFIHKAMGM
jgi:hypothetical protein